MKNEFDEKINSIHDSIEERYVDFIDTNSAMVKSDSDLDERLNAIQEVVLDLEEEKMKNNASVVTIDTV